MDPRRCRIRRRPVGRQARSGPALRRRRRPGLRPHLHLRPRRPADQGRRPHHPVTGVVFDPTNPAATSQVGCTIRSYAFTGAAGDNGSRTASASTTYPGGDCTTTPGATSTRTHGYDTADRPTTGASLNGGPAGAQYVYDQLGRQTTMPAVDAPDPTKGDITTAYYDTDLPQAITQAGTTTTYTLNVNGRRQASPPAPPAARQRQPPPGTTPTPATTPPGSTKTAPPPGPPRP